MNYRKGNRKDIKQLMDLAVKSWEEFQLELTYENWIKLCNTINNEKTYSKLLENAECIVCENDNKEIIGMAFIVPKGNPTEIYDEKWCHLRFVSVSPTYRGNGIGKTLTKKCIEYAKNNGEQIMALHTSEIMVTARHIYEKLGFKILKEIDQRLGVRYWLYTLELN